MLPDPNILMDHNGDVADQAQYQFPAPDPGIGTELSRHGIARRHSPSGRMGGADAFRLTVTGFGLLVLGAVLGAGIGTGVTMALEMSTPFIFLGSAVVMGVLMSLVVLRLRKRAWVCTYIGTEGIARLAQFEQGGRIEREILRFGKASELKAAEGKVAVSGVEGNAFDFSWRTPTGSEIFSIRGMYRGEPAGADSDVYFARAAREAFTQYQLRSVVQASTMPYGTGAVPPPPPTQHRRAA